MHGYRHIITSLPNFSMALFEKNEVMRLLMRNNSTATVVVLFMELGKNEVIIDNSTTGTLRHLCFARSARH